MGLGEAYNAMISRRIALFTILAVFATGPPHRLSELAPNHSVSE
jgi:hypothetical protein